LFDLSNRQLAAQGQLLSKSASLTTPISKWTLPSAYMVSIGTKRNSGVCSFGEGSSSAQAARKMTAVTASGMLLIYFYVFSIQMLFL